MLKVWIKTDDGVVEVLEDPKKMALFADGFGQTTVNAFPSMKLFNKCMAFADQYLSSNQAKQKIYDDMVSIINSKFKGYPEIKDWYKTFISDITVCGEILKFVELAETSGNQTLFTIACSIIINDMHLSPDDFRDKYKIPNDLTQKELEQLAKEDKLLSSIIIDEDKDE